MPPEAVLFETNDWYKTTYLEKGTPLSIASFWGCTRIVEYLLQIGAKANNPNEVKALYNGVKTGKYKIIRLLLEAGIDIKSENYKALKEAVESDLMSFVQLMIKYIPEEDRPNILRKIAINSTNTLFKKRVSRYLNKIGSN